MRAPPEPRRTVSVPPTPDPATATATPPRVVADAIGGPVDDSELARRAARNFGELLATVARCGIGPAAEVRRPDAVGGASPSLGGNPWLHAAVVPFDAVPPADDPLLPYCVWTYADRLAGRAAVPAVVTPCMAVSLADVVRPVDGPPVHLVAPPPEVVGAMNDRAYDSPGSLAPLLARIDDGRLRTHGIEVDGRPVCVAMTLALDDDLGIHYVATEPDHRRRGVATRLLTEVLSRAAEAGFRTATLQASPDGRPVYLRMGFHQVGELRGFVRPDAATGG